MKRSRLSVALWGLGIVALIQGGFMLFSTRYSIGFDPQKAPRSSPYLVFLVDKKDQDLRAGEYFLFALDDRHLPWFRTGGMLKKPVGFPGQSVALTEGVLTVDGQEVARVNPRIHKKITDARPDYPFAFDAPEVVPADKYVMVNESFDSFDSRYFGYIDKSAVRGRGIPLF